MLTFEEAVRDIAHFDFHTHRMDAPAGTAVVSLPRSVVRHPETFSPMKGAFYSAGIHPWWTDEDVEREWEGVQSLAAHPQVVMIGEAGFDALRGDLTRQGEMFERQTTLSERLGKPLVIHCVQAFHLLLAARKRLRPQQTWTIHGFRGKEATARQLLDAGMHLSFGEKFSIDALRLCPTDRLHIETDDARLSLEEIRAGILPYKALPSG